MKETNGNASKHKNWSISVNFIHMKKEKYAKIRVGILLFLDMLTTIIIKF